jgi:hypothetical protein
VGCQILVFLPCMHKHTQGIRLSTATAAGNAERGDMPSVPSSFATANQTMAVAANQTMAVAANQTMAVAAMPSYMGMS